MIANRDEIEVVERAGSGPAERDLQIYAAVRVAGRRQADVAAEFGLTQGRVSQIVRRVQQWRVGLGLTAEIERRDQQSVERWLDDLRIEKLYEETMELFRRSCQPRRKERRGKGKSGEWTMETIEHSPGNLQCLKLAARLVEMRREADQANPPAAISLAQADERVLLERLCDLRMRAEDRGIVPPSEVGAATLVEQLLGELLGWRRHEPRRAPAYDFAAADFADPEQPLVGSTGPAEPELASNGGLPNEDPRQATAVAANAPAIISDISAAASGDRGEPIAATVCRAASCDQRCDVWPAAAGANNSEVFSPEIPVHGANRPPEGHSWPCASLGPPWMAGDAAPISIHTEPGSMGRTREK